MEAKRKSVLWRAGERERRRRMEIGRRLVLWLVSGRELLRGWSTYINRTTKPETTVVFFELVIWRSQTR